MLHAVKIYYRTKSRSDISNTLKTNKQSKNLYRKQQTMNSNCAAIGQHTFPKQVKSRWSYKLFTASAACQNKQIISDSLHHLLPPISLCTVPLIHYMYLMNFQRKVKNVHGWAKEGLKYTNIHLLSLPETLKKIQTPKKLM